MKKSEKYQLAMIAVLEMDTNSLTKLEVLKQLMDDQGLAEWNEKQEEAK